MMRIGVLLFHSSYCVVRVLKNVWDQRVVLHSLEIYEFISFGFITEAYIIQNQRIRIIDQIFS